MYILTGSITSASRLAKAVEKIGGRPASVVHTPSSIHGGGCSYSVRCDDGISDFIYDIAKDNGITIKGIYAEKYQDGERVYIDISR